MKPIPRYVRLRSAVPAIPQPIASMENGYLWIGSKRGPCVIAITGKKTLLTIAAMIRRYAR